MLAIGSDHGGYELKEALKKHLDERNIEYKDFGTYSTESVDYPEYALKVSEAVAEGKCEAGIICCGTGIGVSMAANKVPGIRAARLTDVYSAKLTKQHNNANVICLGGRVTGIGLAEMIFDAWYDTEYEGERHQKRLDKITEIEKKYNK